MQDLKHYYIENGTPKVAINSGHADYLFGLGVKLYTKDEMKAMLEKEAKKAAPTQPKARPEAETKSSK